jgi:NAD(P)-dependent dehydrogenase (short-subunit alcohol dehydrogenase family)
VDDVDEPGRREGSGSPAVALVTGASRGIGLAIAAALIKRGARVAITARDGAALSAAAERLGRSERVLPVTGDTVDPDHRSAAVAATIERFGGLDVLVNNAGINAVYGTLMENGLDGVRQTFDANVVAPLGWIQEVHRRWMGEHGGAIVNITSIAGLRPAGNIGAYAATKAALTQLTQQLAVELGPRVRVNAVAPAVVKTQFAAALYEGREAEVAAGYPLGRIGLPDDVASAVAFLASGDAGWISGETLVVDGGFLATGGVDA